MTHLEQAREAMAESAAELAARRLVDQWERAAWRFRRVGWVDKQLVAADASTGTVIQWSASSHLELSSLLGLGVRA